MLLMKSIELVIAGRENCAPWCEIGQFLQDFTRLAYMTKHSKQISTNQNESITWWRWFWLTTKHNLWLICIYKVKVFWIGTDKRFEQFISRCYHFRPHGKVVTFLGVSVAISFNHMILSNYQIGSRVMTLSKVWRAVTSCC